MIRRETIRFSEDCEITLALQDCFEEMGEMEKGSVDVVVTSPPYNIGIKYGTYDDKGPRSEYLKWIREWCRKAKRILDDDGSIFFNVGCKPSDQWIPMDVAAQFRETGYILQNVIHWIKAITIDKESAGKVHDLDADFSVGHFKPINSERYVNDTHEYIFHFTKTGNVKIDRLALGVPYQDKSNVERWKRKARDRRCRGNSWFIPYGTIQQRDKDRPHPSTFPPRLPEMCLRLHGLDRVGLVLDPFMGLGHTALACLELEKNFTGFEIDKEYFETAVRLVKTRREQRKFGF